MNPFWMCWVEGTRSPSFKHSSLDEARLEAERLARQEPGKQVYVLVALEFCQVSNLRWQRLDVDTGGVPTGERFQ